jgi:DNA-binding response OmpR family regulator/nitrogen-specific signal transduction histidine kinase
VVAIVTVIRWNAVRQVRLANNLEMEKLQHSQDQKVSDMKLQFFTNISHEFRTPLTLILAPLKELTRKKDDFNLSEEVVAKIGLIQNNAQRLMNLVSQLLDFRKVETGNMKLNASLTNIEDFTSEVCYSFEELAKINNIGFKFTSSLQTKQIWFDRDKMEIVLNNLISNAFKYLQETGKIEVALYEEEDEVLITVSDNGSGISSTEIKHIFDRFYRVNQRESHASTGIGLDLAKRFTEMHHGTISVTSEPNVITEFVVSLPKGNKHLQPGEMVEVADTKFVNIRKESILSSVIPQRQKQVEKSGECILIVEDDPELNTYLVDLLEPFYNIKSAMSGTEGFEKALSLKPDLIISDVVMPGMDGFEFCKKVRNKEDTTTVPFIFLTAKNDEQVRMIATQSGADDFIAKPFDPGLLLEKVKNILLNRKKLQKQYSKSIRLEPSDIEITSSEEVFIEKAIAIIEKNLQNHRFSSEYLASALNMSDSSLYRKLKGLTNSSTAEFIRSIRIKRAAQLLADKEKTITEIAYEVGFRDVKHFRTVFQKQFGCSPSEYRQRI